MRQKIPVQTAIGIAASNAGYMPRRKVARTAGIVRRSKHITSPKIRNTAIRIGIVRNATERMLLTKNAPTVSGTAKLAKRRTIRRQTPSATANKINLGIARNITSGTHTPTGATKDAVIAIKKGAIKFINPKKIVRTPGGAQPATIGIRRMLFAAAPGTAKPAGASRKRPVPVASIIGIVPDAERNTRRLRHNVPITAVIVTVAEKVANAFMNPK